MHEGGLDGLGVEPQLFGDDLRDGEGVGDKGRAVLAQLAAVMILCVMVGLVDLRKVRAGVIVADGLDQMVVHPAHERLMLGREGRMHCLCGLLFLCGGDARLYRCGILFFGGYRILSHIGSSPL